MKPGCWPPPVKNSKQSHPAGILVTMAKGGEVKNCKKGASSIYVCNTPWSDGSLDKFCYNFPSLAYKVAYVRIRRLYYDCG